MTLDRTSTWTEILVVLIYPSSQRTAEAEAVFYGFGNHFVLPVGDIQYPPLFRDNIRDSPETIPPFKSLSLSFDQRDFTDDPRIWVKFLSRGNTTRPRDHLGPNVDPGVERMQFIHDLQKEELRSIWDDRMSIIQRHVKLRFLEVDLEECYCPLGCCRMVDSVLDSIAGHPNYSGSHEESLEHLHITGLASQKELKDARKKILKIRRRFANGYTNRAAIIGEL